LRERSYRHAEAHITEETAELAVRTAFGGVVDDEIAPKTFLSGDNYEGDCIAR